MKNTVALISLLIVAVFLLTSCEKLTASLDGLEQERSPEAVPEAVAENPPEEKPAAEESADTLTGRSVLESEETESEEPDESEATTHTVKMTAAGFSPDKLYIKVGDTVVWKNTRSGAINKAMIIGVRECRNVRSGFLKSGDSFSWTFDTPMTCTIADGIMTTKESKVYVEE